MASKKAFPAEMYVVHSDDGDDSFLAAFGEQSDAIEQAGDGGRVAVYRFTEVREASITHELKPRKRI